MSKPLIVTTLRVFFFHPSATTASVLFSCPAYLVVLVIAPFCFDAYPHFAASVGRIFSLELFRFLGSPSVLDSSPPKTMSANPS